jgi:hypothetical protein
MHTPTVEGIAKKFAPPRYDTLAVSPRDKPSFRPLAVESAATASLEEQISALKEISTLLPRGWSLPLQRFVTRSLAEGGRLKIKGRTAAVSVSRLPKLLKEA